MLDTLNQLFTLPFWILVIIIGLIATLIKEVIERISKRIEPIVPNDVDHFLIVVWKRTVVKLIPIITGGLVGWLVTSYPYPEPFNESAFARFCLGTVSGLVSLFVFPRILVFLRGLAKSNEKQKEEDILDIITSEDESK
jgi:uncharacterized membrane protein YeaQ/YmgE (transglycosylase-associated protein family)